MAFIRGQYIVIGPLSVIGFRRNDLHLVQGCIGLPIYKSEPGRITTQAFLSCASCGAIVSTNGGPGRDDVRCIPCAVSRSEDRTAYADDNGCTLQAGDHVRFIREELNEPHVGIVARVNKALIYIYCGIDQEILCEVRFNEANRITEAEYFKETLRLTK